MIVVCIAFSLEGEHIVVMPPRDISYTTKYTQHILLEFGIGLNCSENISK